MGGQLLIEIVFMHIRLIAKSYVGSPGAFFYKEGGVNFLPQSPPQRVIPLINARRGGWNPLPNYGVLDNNIQLHT